jgi:prepilin-type N-terminal cleavage/methylation domain-containing protein
MNRGRPIASRLLPLARVKALRAFTLIELMIVVGLIAALVGALTLSLGDTGGNSLASAQKVLGSLVGSARAQAAVNQTEARIVIYDVRPPSGDATKFLQLLGVFIASPEGTQNWQIVGSPVYLPRGVYFVPTATTGLLASGVVWPANPQPVSKTIGTFNLSAQPAGTAFAGTPTVFYVEFEPDGSVKPTSSPYTQLAVATGALSASSLPAFNNAGSVHGVLIRPTGAVTFVNDAASF